MKQTNLFDAPVESGADEIPRVKSTSDDRAPFFDNADSLLQATMVQITTEEARSYVTSEERTIFELCDSGGYFVIKSDFNITEDKFYGYKVF